MARVRPERNTLVVQLGELSSWAHRAVLRASWWRNTMADEFTFLGVAAGIGFMLVVILFI